MSTKNQNQHERRHEAILFKKLDLNGMVVAIVAILGGISAFFMYDSRISVLESKDNIKQSICTQCRDTLENIVPRVITLEVQLQNLNAAFIKRGTDDLPVLHQIQYKVNSLELELRYIKNQIARLEQAH